MSRRQPNSRANVGQDALPCGVLKRSKTVVSVKKTNSKKKAVIKPLDEKVVIKPVDEKVVIKPVNQKVVNKPGKKKLVINPDLCEYEKFRLNNINERLAFLKELGFGPEEKVKNVKKPRKFKVHSNAIVRKSDRLNKK